MGSSIMYDPIIDSDTEIYSFVTDEKGGCSTHCPVNKGSCKYYNSITDFCRIHCTTDCLFTPRDPERATPVSRNCSRNQWKPDKESHRRRSSPIRRPISTYSSPKYRERVRYETDRRSVLSGRSSRSSYSRSKPHSWRRSILQNENRKKPMDELEIVIYVTFFIWIFLIIATVFR